MSLLPRFFTFTVSLSLRSRLGENQPVPPQQSTSQIRRCWLATNKAIASDSNCYEDRGTNKIL